MLGKVFISIGDCSYFSMIISVLFMALPMVSCYLLSFVVRLLQDSQTYEIT
jgi:hypothetical protein